MNLLIEQTRNQLKVKTWKIKPSKHPLTIGISRHADLRAYSPDISGIHGSFQFIDDKWWYTPLQSNEKEVCLDRPSRIPFPDGELVIRPLNGTRFLFTRDFQSLGKGPSNERIAKWIVIYTHNMVLRTSLIGPTEKFKVPGSDAPVDLVSKEEWQTIQVGEYSIRHRLISLPVTKDMERPTRKDFIEPGQEKTFLALSICLLLMFSTFLFTQLKAKKEEAPALATVDVTLPPIDLTKKEKPKPIAEKKAQPAANSSVMQALERALPPSSKSKSVANQLGAVFAKIKNKNLANLMNQMNTSTPKSSHQTLATQVTTNMKANTSLAALLAHSQQNSSLNLQPNSRLGQGVGTVGQGGGSLAALGNLGTGGVGKGQIDIPKEDSEVSGGLDREVIQKVIESQLGQVLFCYERSLSANPTLFGKVAVQFIISADGTIKTQKISESTLKSSTVEGCLLQKVAKWRFPKPEGGTQVVVTYPFVFKSMN